LAKNGKYRKSPGAKVQAHKAGAPRRHKFNRPKEIKMSTNRFFYALIVIALVAVAVVALWQVAPTKAASPAHGAGLLQADRSYDAIESIRGSRSVSTGAADHSYDAIEGMRLSRTAPAVAAGAGKCLDDECSYQLPDG
jgi:hypothetical protein